MKNILLSTLMILSAYSCNFLKSETEFDPYFMLNCQYRDITFDLLNNANNGLASDSVTAITTDYQGNLYVGSPGSGLSILRPGSMTFEVRGVGDGLTDTNIHSLEMSQNGVLLVGTPTGMFTSYDYGITFASAFGLGGINDIFISDNNDILVAESALVYFSTNGGTSVSALPSSTVTYNVASDRSGKVFSSTGSGVMIHQNFGDGSPLTKTTGDGLLNATTTDVAVDYRDRVYVGHSGAGGISFSDNGGQSFVTRNGGAGIDGPITYKIQTDACDHVYLGTSNALSVSFDRANSFTNFYPPAGMNNMDELHVTKSGRVFVGSSTSSVGVAVSHQFYDYK